MRLLPAYALLSLALAQLALAQVDVDDANELDGIDESATNPALVPGDPDIAVGHDVIIQVVNRWMRMWARNANGDWTAVGNADLTSFFASVERDATDPRVIFDPVSERFFVCAFGAIADDPEDGPYFYNILLAISEPESEIVAAIEEDPPGDPFRSTLWTQSPLQGFFPQDNTELPLHPVEGPCASGNAPGLGLIVDQPSLGSYSGGVLINSILAGTFDADNVFYLISRPNQQGAFEVAGPAFGSDFVLPAGTLGCAPTSFGFPKAAPIKGDADYDHALFVGVDWNAQTETCDTAGKFDSFILYSFNDPFNDLSDRSLARVTVSCFASGDCVQTEGEGGMDPETEVPLDGYDTRVQSAQVTIEGESEYLWIMQSIGAAGTFNKPICRRYKIDLNGWPASGTATPFVDSSGTVGPPSSPPPPSSHPEMGRFYPAGIVDPSTGTLGVVFARSSPDETTSVRAWGRLANGTIFTPVVAKQSPVGDTPDLGATCVRWGDYSDVELDPDDGSFWSTGMYMKEGGEDPELWGTWIFRFTVD
jgi:hypothetical protein